MTRKNLLARLNQLTMRYNLTWEDISSEADKAIDLINDALGANYPYLSQYFLHDNAVYVIRTGDSDLPIIADKYFNSVIIPYITMEVLARDEEFTASYTKYESDYIKGLSQMVVNEFNNIPDRYKRDNFNCGVIFPAKNKGVIKR